jgi:hypothetical protein
MQTTHILIIMYVVFCLFMLANWFNRPRKKFFLDEQKGFPSQRQTLL